MSETWRTQTFGDKELIFKEGQAAAGAYLVREGKVRIFRESGGHEVTLGYVNPGQVFGEMGLLGQEGRSASAQAIGPVEVEFIGQSELRAWVRDDRVWSLLMDMAARLREMDEMFDQLQSEKLSRQDIVASWSARRSWMV